MKSLIILAFLLTACTPGMASPITPPVSLAQAQADISGQIAATATAERIENRQATATAWALGSEATRIHLDQLNADASATQAIRATDTARTATADSSTATAVVTAQAIMRLATDQADTLTRQAWSNQIEIQRVQADSRKQDIERYSDLWFYGLLSGIGVVLIIMVMLSLFLGSKWIPPTITALGENRSRILVARGISQSLNNNGHRVILNNVPASRAGLPEFEVKLARGRETVIEDPEPADSLNDDNRSVWRGLKNMAGLVGGHSDRIPSSSERVNHGLYNEVYQPIINALKQSNDIVTIDGKPGLWVNRLKWNDIDALMGAIVGNLADYTGRVKWNGNKRPT